MILVIYLVLVNPRGMMDGYAMLLLRLNARNYW